MSWVSSHVSGLHCNANELAVHHDAANIKLLTKADMIAFFKQFIDPASPKRSKLAVHLTAQASAPGENGDAPATNGETPATNGEYTTKTERNGTVPYIINDVREFKSMLQISKGPQPVKHISEFEELDSKL